MFYQILFIILIMSAFLALQASNNIGIMNNMQKATQAALQNGAFRINQISSIKQEIINLQAAYSDALLNEDSALSSSDNISAKLLNLLSRAQSKFNVYQAMAPNDTESLAKELNSLTDILSVTLSKENYVLVKNIIFDISIKLDYIYNQESSTTAEVVISNEKYLNVSKRNSVIIMLLSVLCSFLVGLIIVNAISQPLKQMVEAAKSLAKGDLRHNLNATGSPEISIVIFELNQAIEGLRELVKHITSQSNMLNSTSEELTVAANESGKAASEVAKAMEDLTKGANQQTIQLCQAVNTVQTVSEMVEKVSVDTEKIAKVSQKIAFAAQTGLKANQEVTNDIQQLFTSTRTVNEVIMELDRASQEISEVTTTIEGIAEQTSLLSLNAAIEAARAGEHGKGFAIVAHETSKLAEQSKQAVSKITELVDHVGLRTKQAVTVMNKAMGQAENSKNLAIDTHNNLHEIFQSLNNTLVQIDEVAKLAREMADSNKQVTESITMIAAISQEELASAEEVLATSEEQSTSAEQVAALAENLQEIAFSLIKAVAVFELDGE
ncbi:MAG TPA: HAMP domain-containing methyl-accepting chemotaxis protein [Bacillota bacterium]|nr:HAMP domain-containing methyl-accepting chemotaxis protein [Bacillota bacterium]